MGVFATRLMTLSLAGFKCFHKKWLFGGPRDDNAPLPEKKVFDFCGRRKIFYGISIAVLVVGLIASVVVGPKLDIQFAGGSMINYTVEGGEVSGEEGPERHPGAAGPRVLGVHRPEPEQR